MNTSINDVNASADINADGTYDVFFDFKDAERRVALNVVAGSADEAEALVSQGHGVEESKYVGPLNDDEDDCA